MKPGQELRLLLSFARCQRVERQGQRTHRFQDAVQATLTGRGVKLSLLQVCESSDNLDEIDASLQAGKDNMERRFIAAVPGKYETTDAR